MSVAGGADRAARRRRSPPHEASRVSSSASSVGVELVEPIFVDEIVLFVFILFRFVVHCRGRFRTSCDVRTHRRVLGVSGCVWANENKLFRAVGIPRRGCCFLLSKAWKAYVLHLRPHQIPHHPVAYPRDDELFDFGYVLKLRPRSDQRRRSELEDKIRVEAQREARLRVDEVLG